MKYMDDDESIMDIEYSESAPSPSSPPPSRVSAPPPPSRPRHRTVVVIITAIVAALITLAIIIAVFNPFLPPFVGTWHITYEEIYYGNYNIGGKVDYYITFYANHTGQTNGSEIITGHFQWKDIGNNQIEIYKKGDSTNFTVSYSISGNKITFTYSSEGKTIKLKGVRV
ncbi:MAG: hypothetical protein GXO25_03870 [Euryarchaeota archaeon]|nr:hypothetical protein [Euryarchaeota archaeon]